MAKVEIYTTPYCPYCVRAKALLQRKGVPYTEYDVTGDHQKRQWLVEQTGQRTVPQVFIDGRSMGGYDDIAALDRQGRLDPLLGIRAGA